MQSVQGEPRHRQPEPAGPSQGGPQEVLVLLREGRHPLLQLLLEGGLPQLGATEFPVAGSQSLHVCAEVRAHLLPWLWVIPPQMWLFGFTGHPRLARKNAALTVCECWTEGQ